MVLFGEGALGIGDEILVAGRLVLQDVLQKISGGPDAPLRVEGAKSALANRSGPVERNLIDNLIEPAVLSHPPDVNRVQSPILNSTQLLQCSR
mgnify:CR=1 FL=1